MNICNQVIFSYAVEDWETVLHDAIIKHDEWVFKSLILYLSPHPLESNKLRRCSTLVAIYGSLNMMKWLVRLSQFIEATNYDQLHASTDLYYCLSSGDLIKATWLHDYFKLSRSIVNPANKPHS